MAGTGVHGSLREDSVCSVVRSFACVCVRVCVGWFMDGACMVHSAWRAELSGIDGALGLTGTVKYMSVA
jgi:hypothetical protein